ncbi:hypothetical protein [Oceanithermus sp.]
MRNRTGHALTGFAFLLALLALTACTPGNPAPDNPGAAGDWRLPEGYYEPAKMPMVLVHPRPEAPGWAYARNAYPGLRWEIPIVVQGGAWPFRYEIADDGGAEGLEIGGEMTRIREGGWILHRPTPEYGTLWWDDPKPGSYDLKLRVTDQEGSTLGLALTLTVGTEGWVFVDAEQGSDATGDGSLERPFASLQPLYGDPSPYAHQRVVLAGVVPMNGNQTNGNLRIADDLAPRIYVGWPGREAVLEAFEGKVNVDSPDFYLANLEFRDRSDYAPDTGSYLHMITVWDDTRRFTMHRVHVSRFQGVPHNVGYGNSGVIMLTNNGGQRYHVAMVGNTFSGPGGIVSSIYALRESVFERNVVRDAELNIADGSVWGLFYFKRDNEYVSVRANEIWQNNTWNIGQSPLAMDQSRLIEFAYNVLRAPWSSGRHGALKLFTATEATGYAWTAATPVWIYRNSLWQRVSWEGSRLANAADGFLRIERNALHEGSFEGHRTVVLEGNLEGAPLLDERMRLTGSYRSDYLGRVGAEIAAPAPE